MEHFDNKHQSEPAQQTWQVHFSGENQRALSNVLAQVGLGEERGGSMPGALENADWTVRAAAVRALGMSPSPVSLAPLVQALHDEHAAVRSTAARMLGLQEVPRALEALLAALSDPDWRVRTAALQALGKQQKPIPGAPLLACLEDENESVRAAAVWAIGKTSKDLPQTQKGMALQDSSWLVREVAQMAFQEQGYRGTSQQHEGISRRIVAEHAFNQLADEAPGQKLLMQNWRNQVGSWFRFAFSCFTACAFIPAAALVFNDAYSGRFELAIRLIILLVVCVSAVLLNVFVQKRPAGSLSFTGETRPEFQRFLLAGVSLLVLICLIAVVENKPYVPAGWPINLPTPTDMLHAIFVGKMLAISTCTAALLALNVVFKRIR